MRHLFTIILLIATSQLSFSAVTEKIDELFVLYDYGETQVLKEVIEQSRTEQKKIKVITMATAADHFTEADDVINIKEIIKLTIDRTSWPREKEISQQQVNLLTKKYNPKTVITGVVSKVQNQVADAYKNRSHVIGVYDSFSKLKQTHITASFVHQVDELWIPSTLQVESFKNAGFHKIVTIGHPSVKEWAYALKEAEQKNLKKLYQLSDSKKILTYIGGYGNDYENGLDYFFNSISKRDDLVIIISLHPKSDGEIERQIIENYPHLNITIASKEISTIDISAVSDIIVSQNSTAGIQALFQNKDVLYYHLHKQYKNIGIDQGLVEQLDSKDELNKYLDNFQKTHKLFDIKKLGLIDERLKAPTTCIQALKSIYY